jgi:hypothetical protein
MSVPARVNWYRISLFVVLSAVLAWGLGFAIGVIVILYNS